MKFQISPVRSSAFRRTRQCASGLPRKRGTPNDDALSPVTCLPGRGVAKAGHLSPGIRRAFSLVELMVVVSLFSLIVVALMAVFDSTQRAFRSSVTQTDVLEGGRAAMDLMTTDLRQMAPSFGQSNSLVNNGIVKGYYSTSPVNFYANTNLYNATYPQPLLQSLAGSSVLRTNVLENFFILSRGNLNGSPAWFGVGYAVNPAATNDLNPLYRFYMTTNVEASPNPAILFNTFMTNVVVANTNAYTSPNWSHLLDGVVHLTVRAYDTNGIWMPNGYASVTNITAKNVLFLPSALGEGGFYMFSNTLPASVEIQLGVLEDRALRRAETWPNGSPHQTNYLAGQAGAVHIFRQRVTIPNVDPSAYQ
jgi:prepilin-type N-terminal cleavage/methylation domain-containing protein